MRGKMAKKSQTCGVIGVGAFGEFMLQYLTPYFDVFIYDKNRDISAFDDGLSLNTGDLDTICASDIIILTVPVPAISETIKEIAQKLRRGQLIIDLCSVKVKPVSEISSHLKEGVEYISIHPLFGPQSGRDGIEGLNITVCDVGKTSRLNCILGFLETTLKLNVHQATPENHDREMAYVQGLTHMMAKVFSRMNVPEIQQKTKTYMLLSEMVEMIRYDSDELFLAIQRENPYVEETKQEFFQAVKALEEKLKTDVEQAS